MSGERMRPSFFIIGANKCGTSSLDRWTLGVVRDVAHLVGSCPMGDPAGPGTVVNPECRVLGIDGLRVIDASVFPSVPRANTTSR